MIDYELIFGVLVALAAIVREAQNRNMKAKILATISDSSNDLAYIYDQATHGEICSTATMTEIGNRTAKVWTDLKVLGPAVVELLDQKSSLAETLKPTTAPEAGK